MRVDARKTSNHLHWHDGTTCHGAPTLSECLEEAVSRGWVGKVLQKGDVYEDGTKVQCFTLIAGSFEHYEKQGVFVAEVVLTTRLL